MSARTIPDVSMIARAIQRPGIDPRAWVSLALVQSVVVDTDGAFCDVLLVPSNRLHTARLGAAYAGSGWGLFLPPLVDDEVVVLAPDGDPSAGLVIVSRLWSQVDAPPTEAQANPEDAVLVVQPDKSLRLSVSGGGKVYIGGSDGTKAVAHVDSDTSISLTPADIAALTLTCTVGGVPIPVVAASSTSITGKITSGSAVVEVKP
jgi:phage baseplate assembly protein gpV